MPPLARGVGGILKFIAPQGPTRTAVTFITKSNQKFWGASNRYLVEYD